MGRTIVDLGSSAPLTPTIPKTKLVIDALLRKCEEARQDPAKFYAFVIRDEIDRKKLEPAPHQEVLFSFVVHHPKSGVRMPVGTGKTFSMGSLGLWLLGNDVTQRGAVVSAIQDQSKKVLSMISDYITEPSLNKHLIAVFPWLQKSPRPKDPWTQKAIVVDRPPAIRDPSVAAVGFDGKISGARLSWFVGDDILDDTNTYSLEIRKSIQSRFEGRLLSRLDPRGSRAVVTNTPWDRDDLTYYLENQALWPWLTMDIYGNIRISNADAGWMEYALEHFLRPSTVRTGDRYDWYRLKAHDPDPNEEIPLWPERISLEEINEIRYGTNKGGRGGLNPREFARLYLCDPMSDDAPRCEAEWVDACKRRGRGLTLVPSYDGPDPTYTGLDLGVGKRRHNDKTVFFTFTRESDGSKQILDVESGRFTGPEIIQKIIQKTEAYGSQIYVETNAAQEYIKEFAVDAKKDLQIHAHQTSHVNKYHVDWGVESIFTEFCHGAWIIPCDDNLRCHAEVQNFLDDCLYYQPPPAHTGDHLMAAWIGREGARKKRHRDPPPKLGKRRDFAKAGGF